jgi:heterodisulfide reductase subunit E
MEVYYSELSFAVMTVAGFATVILFCGGLLFQMQKWGYGSEGYGKPGQGGSIVGFLKLLLSQIFDKKHEQSVLTTLVMDILIQRRILKRSVIRWVMHITIFWGWIMLFVFSMLMFVVELLHKYGGMFHDIITEGRPIVENFGTIVLLNEVFGYLLLVGVLIAIARRLFITEVRNGTTFYDVFLTGGLFIIVMTGFIAEWVRDGYFLEQYSAYIPSDIAALFHVVISLLFCVALIPFTKYIHIIATPLSILANGGGE